MEKRNARRRPNEIGAPAVRDQCSYRATVFTVSPDAPAVRSQRRHLDRDFFRRASPLSLRFEKLSSLSYSPFGRASRERSPGGLRRASRAPRVRQKVWDKFMACSGCARCSAGVLASCSFRRRDAARTRSRDGCATRAARGYAFDPHFLSHPSAFGAIHREEIAIHRERTKSFRDRLSA